MNDLGFIKSVDGLCEGIVVTVTDTADGGLDPSFGQALSIFYRDVLAAAIAVMNKTSAVVKAEPINAFAITPLYFGAQALFALSTQI